jgi:hypothetical protein
MAKNKLSDLNDHLFMALERLNDEELTTEQIESESKRAEAIIGVANQIIGTAKITLDAMKLVSNGNLDTTELPENFGFKRLVSDSTQNGR